MAWLDERRERPAREAPPLIDRLLRRARRMEAPSRGIRSSSALPMAACEACFRHYLVQDLDFITSPALTALPPSRRDAGRHPRRGGGAFGDRRPRDGLHVAYCAGWGLGEAAMAAATEADATIAYTRFVLERGPRRRPARSADGTRTCVVGYAEIGRCLRPTRGLASTAIRIRPGSKPTPPMISSRSRLTTPTVQRLAARRAAMLAASPCLTTFRQATRLEAALGDGLASAGE